VQQRPEIRSFGLWFLLSVVTFGIANIFYQYYIIKDMERLEYQTKHDYSNAYFARTTRLDAFEMLLWYIFFSPVFFYKKYETLHQHLKTTHRETRDLPPSGQTVVIAFIVIIFTFWLVIPLLIVPFLFLYWEWKWQAALNQHIRNHGLA
jgi:hypothetical protein